MARKTPSAPVQHTGFSMPVYSIAARPTERRWTVILAWLLVLGGGGAAIWSMQDLPARVFAIARDALSSLGGPFG